ncbi:MAG: SUKH-3 domain-containing protein [Ruminococcus sp.]|nr:SUKH-3 domain-containing protein [Ruminococcus sp.]
MDERFPLNGTVDEKIMTCLRAAGWYEGRQVDLNGVKAFYASGGITLPAGAEAFLREYYGIAEGWHMNNDGWTKSWNGHHVRKCADIMIELYPRRGLPNDIYFYEDDEDVKDQQRAEAFAGESLVYVGNIGYYYPAAVYLGSTNMIYTTHDYDEIVYCYDSLPEMLRYDFLHADEWHFVAMEQIVYDVNDPLGWRD